MRHNYTTMFTRGSHIEIIHFSNLQKVLDNRSKVFDTPKCLPPIRDRDQAISLIPGSVPPKHQALQISLCPNYKWRNHKFLKKVP